jgi:hypothetical protein
MFRLTNEPGGLGLNATTGEAISVKRLNTLTASNIRQPQKILGKLTRYISDAADYEPYWDSELAPERIQSKTIQLGVPEYTPPAQWHYLLRAICYGRERGVSVVITWIRE